MVLFWNPPAAILVVPEAGTWSELSGISGSVVPVSEDPDAVTVIPPTTISTEDEPTFGVVVVVVGVPLMSVVACVVSVGGTYVGAVVDVAPAADGSDGNAKICRSTISSDSAFAGEYVPT